MPFGQFAAPALEQDLLQEYLDLIARGPRPLVEGFTTGPPPPVLRGVEPQYSPQGGPPVSSPGILVPNPRAARRPQPEGDAEIEAAREKRIRNLEAARAVAEGTTDIGEGIVRLVGGEPAPRRGTPRLDLMLQRERDIIPAPLLRSLSQKGYQLGPGATFAELRSVAPVFSDIEQGTRLREEGALDRASREKIATMNVEAAEDRAAAVTERMLGMQDRRIEEAHKRAIRESIAKDSDKVMADLNEALIAGRQLQASLAANSAIADVAKNYQAVRLAGDRGQLARSDVQALAVRRGAPGLFFDRLKILFTGRDSEAVRAQISELTQLWMDSLGEIAQEVTKAKAESLTNPALGGFAEFNRETVSGALQQARGLGRAPGGAPATEPLAPGEIEVQGPHGEIGPMPADNWSPDWETKGWKKIRG